MKNKLSEIIIEDSVDYTGELNTHDDYLRMLNILEEKSDFIGITYKHEIIDKFQKDIINIEKTNSWWGIETSYIETISYIKTSKELFEFLKKYETFTKYFFGDLAKGTWDSNETTDFGSNDIAFFDENNNLLLRTNTHEGFIFVSKNIHEIYMD